MARISPSARKKQSTAPGRSSSSGRTGSTVPKRPKPVDRRVLRTRRTLHEALVALVRERGWDDVSVLDVCARADVGRSTFYMHFADKEELLVSGFGDLQKVLAGEARRARPLGFTLALLEHTAEYEALTRALAGKRTAQIVQRTYLGVLFALLEEDIAHFAPTAPLVKPAVRYLGGAFWELLRWWDEQRPRPSAREVDAIFRQLALPVLRELRRLASAPKT